MARRRIRLGNEGRRGPWPEVEERRGWWNRKPPPRGSLVPRSTISRQHNSSPLVHSPQPSGTAETSTLILLVGSLFPASLSSPDRSFALSLSFSLFSSLAFVLALAGERPTASLVLFLPQLHPRVPLHTRAPGFIQLHLRVPPALFQ